MSFNKRAFLFTIGLFFFVFSGEGAFASVSKNESIASKHEDIVIAAVHQSIRDNKLTNLRDNCLLYDYDDSTDKLFYLVNVRENNRYAICGGDPEVSVQLFRFKVSKKDYSLYTDFKSEDGGFYSIVK